jgi:2-aminoethylphosphonate-pyruvate transaminase
MATKREMLVDHAMDGQRIERDIAFSRDYLLKIANADGIGTAIPLSGPATGANEAAIQTFVPVNGKLLVYSNGVFGDRLAAIAAAIGLPHTHLRTAPAQPLSAMQLWAALASDSQITHVMAVHCETSTGIVNPIQEIANLCEGQNKKLLIDAVSSFGALDIDMRALQFEALTLGCNKCLQGPPGLAWVIADENSLRACKGNARSLTLDLWDQWQHFEAHKSFRFTPPTHVVAGCAQALREHQNEGGSPARLSRYARNRARLVAGMRELGFETLLPQEIAAPVVATFLAPNDPFFDPVQFCRLMAYEGFQISLRRAAVPNTLRMGCIGDVDEADMAAAVAAAKGVLLEMRTAVRRLPQSELPRAQMSR